MPDITRQKALRKLDRRAFATILLPDLAGTLIDGILQGGIDQPDGIGLHPWHDVRIQIKGNA
jgi:hypothetical protein